MLLKSHQEARILLGGNNGAGVIESGGGGGEQHSLQAEPTDDTLGIESPIHPLGIKPSGNKLLSTGTTDAREAIGTFQALPDGMALLTLVLSFPSLLMDAPSCTT